jgi:hypothetical protein
MVGSGTTRERLAWAFVYGAILAIGVTLGIRVIVDGYSPVPFGDFWAQASFLERGLQGDVSLGDLWAQWNEHRIFLARLHFLLDYWLFDGTNVFLFVAIATSCLLLAVTFATAVWIDSRDWLLALGSLAVAGTSALPLAGIENLTLAFNVHFVQTFLFATISILAVIAGARSVVASRQAIWSGVSAIAAVAATYSTANGVLTWVVVVLLAILLRLERRLTAALAIVGAVTIATFLWHSESSTGTSLSDPVGLVHFVALYLGSALTPSPATAAIVGAAGLVLFPLLCRLVWVGRSGGAALVPFGAGVAGFVVLTSASTAVGRLEDFGTSQALASRYSIGSFTFWLGLFVGFLPAVRERLRSVPIAVPAYLGGAAVVALVLGYQTIPPSSELRAVVVGREATVVAYRAGVEDASNSVPNVQGGPGVTSALRWMERERLGPWAPGGMVDAMRVAGPSNRTDRACLGEIESAEPVRAGSRLRGWIATPNGETSSRNTVVLDAGGRRRGLGLVGMQRPDVEPPGADAEWSGFVAYVSGKPAVPLEVVLLAKDGANAVCRLTWAGGRRD